MGKQGDFTIVETGTISDPGGARWALSGQATLLFDRFLNYYNGTLYSIDLDPEACRVARAVTSPRTVVVQGEETSRVDHSLPTASLAGSVFRPAPKLSSRTFQLDPGS